MLSLLTFIKESIRNSDAIFALLAKGGISLFRLYIHKLFNLQLWNIILLIITRLLRDVNIYVDC